MDDAVRAYVEAIPAERRPLFDRVHALIVEIHPDVDVVISYGIPTYVRGRKRFYVGVWKHGLSFYGWVSGHDGGFSARHPDLVTSKGTLKLRPQDAGRIDDDELRALIRAAL